MGQCAAKVKNGTPCQIPASTGKKYCHIHQKQRLLRSALWAAIWTIALPALAFIADVTGILGFLGISIPNLQGVSLVDSSISIDGDVSNSPIIQSGGGDVNLFQSTTPPEMITSDQILRCMGRHNMDSQKQEATDEFQDRRTQIFQFCEWPPQTYSEPDGYSEITVETAITLDDARARADLTAPIADRIKSNCEILKLAYSFGAQMMYANYPEFEIPVGTIDHLYNILGAEPRITQAWDGTPIFDGWFLGFYPERNETVILHLDVDSLDNVECIPND